MLIKNQLFANRYRLVKRLGQGAFSEVWKAEDTKVGNLTVALKVYAPDKGLDEDGSKVFGDEFAIVFNLHHQNLLTPSTFDEENGSPYLVLPFCEQGSSLKLVGKMDERKVAQFLRDVSAALAYLHAKDIIHQDIKPDNVLIDGEGNFMVTDFGISTRIRSTLRRSVGDKKSAGTMAYMGPERFSKTPHAIKASDVWSLGTTVYELMTGDVPFGDMGGGMQKSGADIPDVEGDYSSELKQLVEQCLAKEPWDRPAAEQIRNICDGYLRTGKWDLSVLGKEGVQEPERPEKPQEPAGRKTVRKVNAVKEPELPHVETPTRQDTEKPKTGDVENSGRRKWLPWVIGGVLLVAIFLIIILKQGHVGTIEELYGWIDLGLPSGTLWKDKNEEGGFYTYDEAISNFGDKLPTEEQFEELKYSCQWTWTGDGYRVVGPSGKSIFLPAEGYRNCIGYVYNVGSGGHYWSSTSDDSESAWHLHFNSGFERMYSSTRCYGFAVRLVQD